MHTPSPTRLIFTDSRQHSSSTSSADKMASGSGGKRARWLLPRSVHVFHHESRRESYSEGSSESKFGYTSRCFGTQIWQTNRENKFKSCVQPVQFESETKCQLLCFQGQESWKACARIAPIYKTTSEKSVRFDVFQNWKSQPRAHTKLSLNFVVDICQKKITSTLVNKLVLFSW